MADRLSLLLEAERRGLAIDADDLALLAEARKRGLIAGEAATDRPGLGAAALQAVRNRVGEVAALPGQIMERAADPTQRLVPNPLDLIPKPPARVVLPLVAGGGPLFQAGTSMAGEVLSQTTEKMRGERESYDPLQVGVAGAIPLTVAGGVRVARGLERTATRAIPSRFAAKQAAAAAGAEDVAAQMTPEVSAEQLFRSARGKPAAPAVATTTGPRLALPPAGGTSPTAYGPTGRYVVGELSEREGVSRTLEAASASARGAAYREGAGMTVARAPQGPSVAGQVMRRATPTGAAPKAAQAVTEAVPAGRITAILDDLDDTIPKAPTDAGLQQVRAAMENLRGSVQGGAVNLDELMRQRLDLGRMIARRGSAPELKALYGHGGDNAKGIIGALEEAAEAGGAGAANAREALTVFKRDLGVMKWRDLVERATRRTSISGVDTPALSIAKLGDLVKKNEKELTGQLGAEGLALVRGYLTKFRTLPPTHAATAATTLLALMAGAGGGAVGGIPGAAGAILAPEIARNVFAVGRNPAMVNQVLTAIAQATRAAGVSLTVGPEARELARR